MNDFLDMLFGRTPRRPDMNSPQEPREPGDYHEGSGMIMKSLRRGFMIITVLIILLILINQCLVITKADEYIVIQQFGEIRSVRYEPGISFKMPFIQATRSVPKRVKIYDIPISDVITQDKKTMVTDSFVLWRVSDPIRFIRSVNGNVATAEMNIGNISYNSMKNVISQLPQSDLISGRDALAQKIMANIGNSLDEFGVTLLAIETKHLDLHDDNKQAVYTRMISERNNIAASYQAEGMEEARMIRTETDKTVSILLSGAEARAAQTIADGERRYMEILADAYNDPEKADFYGFVRALDASRKALQGDTTIILSSDSPIAQVFYNAG